MTAWRERASEIARECRRALDTLDFCLVGSVSIERRRTPGAHTFVVSGGGSPQYESRSIGSAIDELVRRFHKTTQETP